MDSETFSGISSGSLAQKQKTTEASGPMGSLVREAVVIRRSDVIILYSFPIVSLPAGLKKKCGQFFLVQKSRC